MTGCGPYAIGVRKERKFVNEARAQGHIAFRSAGSHSPIDVCVIDKINKKITFIQSKYDDISEKLKKHIEEEQKDLNGMFQAEFIVK